MKKIASVLLMMLCICTAVFASPGTENLGTVTLAVFTNSQITLNPYIATENYSVIILQNLISGLFEHDGKTGEPVHAIAQRHTVSEDGLTWTFHLRRAYFSNGRPITSSTFVNSWNYLDMGPLSSNLDFIRRTPDGHLDVRTPDRQTLVVNLSHPVPYLPDFLCQPSLGAIEGSDSFSGAYVLEHKNDRDVLLSANPRYWGEVKNRYVHILIGQESEELKDFEKLFLDGTIQWSMAPIDNSLDYMITTPLYATTFFYFSAKDGPYADERVRKALSAIIPWDLVRYMQEALVPSESLVPKTGLNAQDVMSVSNLLAEAGYPGGKGLPPLKIGMNRGARNASAAEVIADLWSRYIGITVLLDTVPVSIYAQDPTSNPYDFCSVTWIADYKDADSFLGLFESNASYNIANYSDQMYDSLLEKSRSAVSEKERVSLQKDAEQYLLNSRTVIPVSLALATDFVRTDLISGWNANQLDNHPFKELSLLKK